MDRGYPHNLKEKLLSEINSNEILVPETKQQGRKMNFAFRDKPVLLLFLNYNTLIFVFGGVITNF